MAAYIVASLTHVTDPTAFEHWVAQVRPIIADFGGTFLAAHSTELVEGDWHPHAVAIIAFASMDELRQCYEVVEQGELRALRQRAVAGEFIAVDGM